MITKALNDLNKVAKVFGSFINNDNDELVAYNMPDEFTPDMLKEAGRISLQGFQGIESTGYSVKKIDLEYDKYRLINSRIDGGIISVLCSKNISLPLLNLTFNVISKKIQVALNNGDVAPVNVSTPKPKPTITEPQPQPAPATKPQVEKQLKPEPVKAKESKPNVAQEKQAKKSSKFVKKVFFDMMEEEFTKKIGPMAKFIIDDYIDEMGENRDKFPPSKVNELITKISTEIDKRTERGKFKQKMKAAFEKSSK